MTGVTILFYCFHFRFFVFFYDNSMSTAKELTSVRRTVCCMFLCLFENNSHHTHLYDLLVVRIHTTKHIMFILIYFCCLNCRPPVQKMHMRERDCWLWIINDNIINRVSRCDGDGLIWWWLVRKYFILARVYATNGIAFRASCICDDNFRWDLPPAGVATNYRLSSNTI